ncbi:MAG: Xaa-Pro dipeptidyl-peptidase [Gemmatimonadales bacterium]|nr:Xaa-Pro dipeptidyl-peptidase [Gemmatimonadales bacterium]
MNRCSAVLFAGAVLLTSATVAAQGAPKAGPVFRGGLAQVVPAFADTAQWIRQELWVETSFDSDHDGRKDRIHVDVTRPGQTASEGLRVPVVMGSSPYYAGTARGQVNWHVGQELDASPAPRDPMTPPAFRSPRPRISNSLVNEWVPRGFAVVHSEQPGTGLSEGCPTVGDIPERMAPKAVIDWLNGRAPGYTTRTGSARIDATSWSTGKVGMIGTSYEGTLPLAAATTGVKGLEVVVPVSPNTSYYHYYRANGLVRSPGGYLGEDVDVLYDFVASGDTTGRANCDRIWKNGVFAGAKGQDRQTGDINEFWRVRDLAQYTKGIRAAVLLAHGFNDYNVFPSHSVRIFDAMQARKQPVSLYMHQGGHGGNPPADMVNRWFTHYLYGVDNGVQQDPPVWIVQDAGMQAPQAMKPATAPTDSAAPRARPRTMLPTPFASFPVPGSEMVAFRPVSGPGGSGSLALGKGSQGTDRLVDDVAMSGSANATATSSPHRLLYATAVLTDTMHISGTPRVTLRIASSKPAANLSVWLVMLPFDSAGVGAASHRGVLTRGWADIRNWKSLTRGGDYQSMEPGEPLVPGRFYDLTFDLEPDDEYVPSGSRLAVMIMSSDRQFTLWPAAGTELTLDLAHSHFDIPVVGGVKGARHAGAVP